MSSLYKWDGGYHISAFKLLKPVARKLYLRYYMFYSQCGEKKKTVLPSKTFIADNKIKSSLLSYCTYVHIFVFASIQC